MLDLFQVKFPQINVHDPCRLLSSNYKLTITKDTFFILLINNNLWVMISNQAANSSGTQWFLYDSMYRTGHLNAAVSKLRQFVPNATLSRVDVQQQEGCNDCGLFALAFVYILASGYGIKKTKIDQSKLRSHFDLCMLLNTVIPYIII
jgi:hypothetical protein